MATYAIGDIQGCYAPFMELLDKIGYQPEHDELWLVGDLVNRGPDSLAVLRWVKARSDRVKVVLGNHDLHLLAVAAGHARQHRSDTLAAVLAAPDSNALLDWLRSQPLFHAAGEYVMVHAGLLPGWSIEQAGELAREVEQQLQGADYHAFLAQLYGNQPSSWDTTLQGMERWRLIINAMTRMRFVHQDGSLELTSKGETTSAPPGCVPWFEHPAAQWADHTVVFGHWSALGLLLRERLIALDSGCLWGNALSAVRLEDRAVFQVPCVAQADLARWL